MAYLDTRGLGDLWARIDSVFARMTAAAGSLVLSGTSLVLRSISGADLSSFDLSQTFATKQYADQAASGAAGGKIAESTANGRFGNSLTISGNQLKLVNYNGTVISTITLP